MICLAIAAGLLAGITGWRHPDPETRTMCRAFSAAAAVTGLLLWSPW
jgi:hypothetical protein